MERLYNILINLPNKIALIVVCFVGSALFGVSFGLGASLAAEFKDKAHGGVWDWSHFGAGMFGTTCGALVNILIIREVWNIFH